MKKKTPDDNREEPNTRTEGWPVRLTLPLPISMNVIWRRSRTHIYLQPAGKEYKNIIGTEVARHMKANGIEMTNRCISIKMWVYWPTKNKRRDVGNVEKLISDAMTGILYVDDTQVFPQFVPPHRCDTDNPRVEIFADEYIAAEDAPVFDGYTSQTLRDYAERIKREAANKKAAGINKAKATRRRKKEEATINECP